MKKFQIAIAILAVTLLACIGMLAKTIPEVSKILEIQDNYKTQTSSLADAERKLEELKKDAERKEAEDENVLKMFFKPISDGLDTEAAISDEFGEILQVMRDNKIKARSVKYDYDPQDDNFVKNAGNKYHVCRVTAEMIANYANFAGFLRELYKHYMHKKTQRQQQKRQKQQKKPQKQNKLKLLQIKLLLLQLLNLLMVELLLKLSSFNNANFIQIVYN